MQKKDSTSTNRPDGGQSPPGNLTAAQTGWANRTTGHPYRCAECDIVFEVLASMAFINRQNPQQNLKPKFNI
jgi:hypothetical protein